MSRIGRWTGAQRNCTNTGLLCGELVGVDIDVLDRDHAHRLTCIATEMLGMTPAARIGRAPKILLAFRAEEPFDKIQTPEFQMLDGTPVIAQGQSEEEMEKRLGAALIAGDVLIAIDNFEEPLGGELLCQAMTQTSLKVRILGKSLNAEVPSNAAIFATGNNLTLEGDMTRRAIRAALHPGVERPELRAFDRDPLAMVTDARGDYVVARLTVQRAYHVAGRPKQATPLGSFAEWSRWVRDALIWLGEADPCDTMEGTRGSDPKLKALTTVLEQWNEVIGDDRVTVRQVIDRAAEQRQSSFTGAASSSTPSSEKLCSRSTAAGSASGSARIRTGSSRA